MESLYNINNDYYYVYEHWFNGEIIYVGKGKENRAFHKKRNEIWNSKVNGNFELIDVKIKGYFKDEQDAFDYEEMLINKYIKAGINLTNIVHNPNINLLKVNSRYSVDSKVNNSNDKSNPKFKSSIKFNHYKQALSFLNRSAKLERHNKKTLIFHYSKDKKLIEYIIEDKKNNPLILSTLKSDYKSNKIWKELNKGNIPKPYNVLIIGIEDIDLYSFKIKELDLNVIIDTTDRHDKEKILNMIAGSFSLLAYKVTNQDTQIKNVELMIPGFYLNKPLTSNDQNNLIKTLDVVGNDGNLVSWNIFKEMLSDSVFYKISESKEKVGNKLVQVSEISLVK